MAPLTVFLPSTSGSLQQRISFELQSVPFKRDKNSRPTSVVHISQSIAPFTDLENVDIHQLAQYIISRLSIEN